MPAVVATIPLPVSTTAMLAQISAAFVLANWTSTPITGGYELIGVSPQGYGVKLHVLDSGSGYLTWQLKTLTGGGTDGIVHRLAFSTAYTYQMVLCPCGFFVSRPGVTFDVNGSAVCGGALYAPASCGLATAIGTITELWWSMGDWGGSPFFAAECPRQNLDTGGGVVGPVYSQCGNLNGTLNASGNPSSHIGTPRILVLASPDTWAFGTVDPEWFDGSDLLYEAFVAWGATVDAQIQIRGQIFNAAIRSFPTAMDVTRKWDGYAWVNYTDNYGVGSLWLITGTATGGSICNYAY
jgi:hypothetical protein